jgi:hypothetical protein
MMPWLQAGGSLNRGEGGMLVPCVLPVWNDIHQSQVQEMRRLGMKIVIY